LPRESGTCTRCPTECRLSSSTEPWKARISIRLIVDQHGNPLEKPTTQPFGEAILSNKLVEERIKRAQLAILNPGTPVADFLKVKLPFSQTNETRFSKNSIILDISGPDVEDLAFVDLPGIIVSGSADGYDNDIEAVENLVGSHIDNPNCLILLAVACETDPENQRGRHLARRYDPGGERTIPVLTKPDRIDRGDENSWLEMMRNQKEKFKHGWYCVKQPGTAELQEKITWDQARQNEHEFFQYSAPWSDAGDLNERLGTQKLSAALGQKLFNLIVKRLPGVSDELQDQLDYTLNELDRLPPDIGEDPVAELLTLIRKFDHRIEGVIEGSVANGLGVVQSATDAYERFTMEIGSETPRFRPFLQRDAPNGEFQEFPAVLELDRLDTKDMKGDILYLDDVLQKAKRSVSRELPGNYPYTVKVDLVKRYLQHWERPSKALVQEVETRLRKELRKVVETEFAEHVHGGLQLAVWNVVDECIRTLSEATRIRVEEAHTMEQNAPTTRRDSYFRYYRNLYLEHYRVHYQKAGQGEGFFDRLANGKLPNPQIVDTILAHFALAGVGNITTADLLKLAPYSENDAALEIMAEVRGYYHIAMQRYIDKIPMLIDHLLVFKLKEVIPHALMTKLPFGKPDQGTLCGDLLKQADDVIAKRKELKGRKARLEKAREELNRLWVG